MPGSSYNLSKVIGLGIELRVTSVLCSNDFCERGSSVCVEIYSEARLMRSGWNVNLDL